LTHTLKNVKTETGLYIISKNIYYY